MRKKKVYSYHNPPPGLSKEDEEDWKQGYKDGLEEGKRRRKLGGNKNGRRKR